MSVSNSLEDQVAEHKELSKLIPWYINGTLRESDACRVKKHLDFCLECRSEFNFSSNLARVIGEEDLQDEAVKANFEVLQKQIAQNEYVQSYRTKIRTTVSQLFSAFGPGKTYRYSVASVAFLVAAGTTMFLQDAGITDRFADGDFQTLSSTELVSTENRNELFVAFQQDATDADITNIFLNHGLKPIGRSEDRLLWRVEIDDESQTISTPQTVIERLKNTGKVLFAERVLAGE